MMFLSPIDISRNMGHVGFCKMENSTIGACSSKSKLISSVLFAVTADMANITLSLMCICFFAAFGGVSSITVNRLIDALTTILTFTLENDEVIDANLLFGVTIVAVGLEKTQVIYDMRLLISLGVVGGYGLIPIIFKGQLDIISQYDDLQVDFPVHMEINYLRELCRDIFQKAFDKNITNTGSNETPQLLFSPELWTFDNSPSHLIRQEEFNSILPNSERKLSPNELEFRINYENCLRILLDQCHFSENCFNQIVKRRSRGYVSTHQILYLQIMKQMLQKNLCSMEFIFLDTKDLDDIMNGKCTEVYVEAQELENRISLTRNKALVDLLLEEVVVCGLQNYVEFFSYRYLDFILEDEFPALSTSQNFFDFSNAVHLMSVKAAARTLYLKEVLFDWIWSTKESRDAVGMPAQNILKKTESLKYLF